MCKASVTAKVTSDAEKGHTYAIGISDHGLGALHLPSQTTAQCVFCVKHDAKLTLAGIPKSLRKKYGLSETETARFIDTGDNAHDLLEFRNGKRVDFAAFANQGIMATVGTVADQVAPTRKAKKGPATVSRTDVLTANADGARAIG